MFARLVWRFVAWMLAEWLTPRNSSPHHATVVITTFV